MPDRYTSFANSPFGRSVLGKIGLPTPVMLDRYRPGAQPLVTGPVLFGALADGPVVRAIAGTLKEGGCEVFRYASDSEAARAAAAGLSMQTWDGTPEGSPRFKALVFDASALHNSTQLTALWRFYYPAIRRVANCARILVTGRPPERCADPKTATAQRALEGFTRSIGKEIGRGGTAQLIYVAEDAQANLASSVRFFLSPRSAYVSGQVVRVNPAPPVAVDWTRPLAGQVALVTGAARGIGESIARTLARDGAHVICLDVPQAQADLKKLASQIQGSTLLLDITEPSAPTAIVEAVQKSHGGLDILVHNAGVTRDKTLGRMPEKLWELVLDINLSSEERINDTLLAAGAFKRQGRIVCVSSIGGIAGNRGQTNYGTSKAGVIGMVQSLATLLTERAITINAVAPGFIETQMTAAIPFAIREAGRRMNSMSQGGLPVDVAETIAWFANPASNGVTGQVVRVCGQSLIGA